MTSPSSFIIDGKSFFSHRLLQDEKNFTVKSIPKSYTVSWDDNQNPLAEVNNILACSPKNLLLIDSHVFEKYRDKLTVPAQQMLVVEATELFKTLEGVTQVIDFLYNHQFTKTNMLVVVGGGIIQEVGGFVAVSYKRGIAWMYFPTTLLSMCDSCIGAKTSVNYKKAKNQIALFSAPTKVIINAQFLKTLSPEALRSGLGEILKLCIIGGKKSLGLYQQYVQKGKVFNWDDYQPLILEALAIKKSVIEEDEFELNHRKSLNYGHTLGHSIETLSDYLIPHGIAVTLGMVLVNELSCQYRLLDVSEKDQLNLLCRELLDQNSLQIMRTLSTSALLDLLKNDKKVEGNEIKFVFVKSLGEVQFVKLPLNQPLENQLVGLIKKGV